MLKTTTYIKNIDNIYTAFCRYRNNIYLCSVIKKV